MNVSYSNNANYLHEFSLDYEKTDSIVIQKSKRDRNGNILYTYYPMVRFNIGLFRHPILMMCMNFLPMFLLAAFCAILYFTRSSMAEDLSILAGIIIAGYTSISNYRQSIPVIQRVTLGDEHIFATFCYILLSIIDAVF